MNDIFLLFPPPLLQPRSHLRILIHWNERINDLSVSRNADKCLLPAFIESLLLLPIHSTVPNSKLLQIISVVSSSRKWDDTWWSGVQTILWCCYAYITLHCFLWLAYKILFIWPANKNQLEQWSSLVTCHESKRENKLSLKKLRLRRDSKPYSQILVGHNRLKYVASEVHFRGFFFRV